MTEEEKPQGMALFSRDERGAGCLIVECEACGHTVDDGDVCLCGLRWTIDVKIKCERAVSHA